LRDQERERRHEMFVMLCLALFSGLRRDEIDTLTWGQIDFGRKTIHVQTTEHGRVKSEGSDRVVDIDDGLAAILQLKMQQSTSTFVIERDVAPKPEAITYHHYRCDRLFDRLVKWLKKHGVEARAALHTLRKEFGSQITLEYGISAASTALGHASILLTKAVYVGKKERTVFRVPAAPSTTLIGTNEAVS
jgi:integrase